VPSGNYERYGLTGNPFRELASENVEDVTLFHVNQETDAALRSIREEVFDRENRAVVAVTGVQGAGKTERLLLTAAEARERKAFCVYFDVTTKTPWLLKGLAAAFQAAAKDAGRMSVLGGPPWLRPLAALARQREGQYDPTEAGRRIGEALNASAPSFLLLNDLHNLVEMQDVDSFVRTIEEITDVIKPGVLVMFGCYASYLAWLCVNHPALGSRINRAMSLSGLSDDEARLVLAKKLLAKRIVEELEPTYPFDRESVAELNRAARGNPRRLLELADVVLERAVATRAYQIDGELARAALVQRDGWVVGGQTVDVGTSRPPTEGAATPEEVPAAPPKRRGLFGRA